MALRGPTLREVGTLLDERGPAAWAELTRRYGPSFRYRRAVATSDPELVRTLLLSPEHTRQRSRGHLLAARVFPGLDGLIFREGEPWKVHARAVMPVFHRDHVATYAGFMHQTARAHAGRWCTGGPDLAAAVTALGTSIVLHVGYGIDAESDLGRRFAEAIAGWKRAAEAPRCRFDDPTAAWAFAFNLPRTIVGMARELRRVRATVRLAMQRPDDGRGPDWIERMAKAGFTLEETADEVCHLYLAYEAIDFTITCALVELSRHPHWARVVREELDRVLGPRLHPEIADLPALPRTLDVMREVLRLYPGTMGVARRTGEELRIEGERIPAGSEMVILLYALHRRPDLWPDADRFDPERWQDSSTPPVAGSFVPFLEGPRKCIGRHLAELQFVVVLSALMRGHHIHVGAVPPLTRFMIPRFAEPMAFSVERLAPHQASVVRSHDATC